MAISIEKFQEQGGRLKTDDIDFEAFRREPLHPDVLRCLSYMHDIEYQTVLYTRELLLMPAWKDPQFTAFLTLWNYEEYWHGQAIGRVLAAHDWPAHDERLIEMRRFNKRYLFWSPVIFWALGHGVRKFPAVHMTWGAINEWTANAAYNRLAQIADHPVLTELLGRIMRQEGRHAAYYASYAVKTCWRTIARHSESRSGSSSISGLWSAAAMCQRSRRRSQQRICSVLAMASSWWRRSKTESMHFQGSAGWAWCARASPRPLLT